MATQAQQTQLLTFLVGTFDAAPTAELFNLLEGALDNGATTAQLAEVVTASDYFTALYADTEAFVANFPSALVGDFVSAEVLSAAQSIVADRIANGDSVADVISFALTALSAVDAADETWGAAASALSNKVTVANYFVENVSGYEFSSVADLQSIVASVTQDAATVTAAQAQVDVLANPGQTFTLTTATNDILVGTAGSDTFTGTAATYDDTDRLVDASTADSDTFTLVESAAVNPDLTNIENIDITLNSVSAVAVDASKIVGAGQLTINRDDVTISGTVVTGNKAASVTNVDASQLAKIIAGAKVTSLNVDSAATDKAGLVVDASTVTGNVTVDGAATIDASASTTTVAIDAVTNTSATETGKASSITANNAATVTTHADLTGSVAIEAAKASTITVADAQGGATVTGGTTSTADTTISVANIDNSGATIVTGTGSSVTAEKQITVDLAGTAASTDTASVSANGVVALDVSKTTAAVDALTLSGASAAVTYNVAASNGEATSFVKSGDNSVTLAGNEARFAGKTVTGFDVVTLNAGTAGTIDASKWTDVANVNIGFDNGGNAITANAGSTWTLTSATQNTGLDFDFSTTSTTGDLNIVVGDVNGSTNNAVGTATVNAFNAAAGATVVGTVNLTANDANFTASGTTLGAKQNLVITGDEDVTLGTVVADSVDASASTGIINLTSTTGVDVVTTGSGNDVLTANGALKHTFSAGSGNDNITITSTNDESSFDGGAGNDQFAVDAMGKVYVVSGGAGDDTFTATVTGGNLDAYIIGGEGTDTLVFDQAGATDLSNGDKFVMAGIDKINITAVNNTLTVSSTQFASNNVFELTGTSDDVFAVAGDTTTTTIDASGLTLASGSAATVEYTGSTKADTITGSKLGETFKQSLGADTIAAGEGTDTYQLNATGLTESGSTEAATGYVVNLGGSALTAAQVYAGISKYLGEGATNVAAGTVAYAYTSADSSTINNSAVVDSVSGFENVTGSGLADYIVVADVNSNVSAGAGADYIKLGGGTDTVTFANVAGIKSTADTISNFSSSDNIAIQATAGGQFADLHAGDGSAFTGATTGSVATVNIAGGAADLGAAGNNVLSINANTSSLSTGYASISDLQTAVDGAAITESGSGAFSDGDELFIVWYNTTDSTYEGGIITIAGGNGFDGADETYEKIFAVETTGVTQAQVAASIDSLLNLF